MIYNILEQIRSTSSKNEKLAILKQNKAVPWLSKYLYLTYSPHINFYMKNVPKTVAGDGGYTHFLSVFEDVAINLSERKYTGNAAQDYVKRVMMELDEQHQQLLTWMITKDVKAGFNISTINKCWSGLIWEPGYMRCSLESDVNFDKWDWNETHYCQLKADGMFVNIIREGDKVVVMSRQGSVFPSGVLGAEHEYLRLTEGYVYHGELTVVGDNGVLPRTEGNGLLNSALQGTPIPSQYSVVVDIWDMLKLDDWRKGEDSCPYFARFEDLSHEVHSLNSTCISVIETRELNSLAEAKAIAGEWMKQGFEGAVLKNYNMPWKDGTSKQQVKLKAEVVVELRMTALTPGTGKNINTFGSITCQSEDGLLVVDVPGYSDELRKEIFDNWDNHYKGKVMSVMANDLLLPGKNNEKHSLFLPRCIEAIRTDKIEADTLEQIKKQFENFGG